MRAHTITTVLLAVPLFASIGSQATTHYVDIGNLTPAAPYDSWATAATNIQSSVDAAISGDTVLVTNGTYYLSSQILVNKAITVESVNGRNATIVDGQSSHRCFSLTNGVIIVGFTIQNGSATFAGGVLCDGGGTVQNCLIYENSANGSPGWGWTGGGGVYCWGGGTVQNCKIYDNSADASTLMGYSEGAGVYLHGGMVQNCEILYNTAGFDSDPSSSRVGYGGGVYCENGGTVQNCVIYENVAGDNYGGEYACYGGGVYCDGGIVQNCTISGNLAGPHYEGGISFDDVAGGGVYSTAGNTIQNCILWDNVSAGGIADNWHGTGTYAYCCTRPDPGGTGNITKNPQFVSTGGYHLQSGSPCIDAGTNLTGVVTDFDGTPRPLDGDANSSAITDMGAYEYFNSAADSDGDSFTDGDEYIADTGITDSNDWFRVTGMNGKAVLFNSSPARRYTLVGCTNLVEANWQPVAPAHMGIGGEDSLTSTNVAPSEFYKLDVAIP